MTRITLLICLLVLISCRNEKVRQDFSVPEANDINEIIKTIISTDSLSNRLNSPLSADLTKIAIILKDTDTIPPPMGTSKLPIKWFVKGYGNKYFSQRDSSYLFFQNNVIPTFRLDSSFSKLIKLTTNDQVKGGRKHEVFFRYYEISLPIFSLDKKIAYVSIDYYCPLCGYGMAIFLKKINGTWKIVMQKEALVS